MTLWQDAAQSTQQAVGYPALFVLVALGALVPVIPTGALVSSAAVVAFHQQTLPFGLLLVFAVASLAAFLGDLALYWLGRSGVRSRGGSRWLERLRGRATPERLAQAQLRLEEHGVLVLVVSRLVPAGRIPVMLACLLAGLPLRRFARGDGPHVPGVGGHVRADRDPGRVAVLAAVEGRGRGGGRDAADQRGPGAVAPAASGALNGVP